MAEPPISTSGMPQKAMGNDMALPDLEFSGRSGATPKNKGDVADPVCRRIILTGDVQCGKSTLAQKLIHRLKTKNITMAGILALGLWKNNQREGFELVNIQTGQVTPLARRSGEPDPENKDNVPFSFFKQGVTAGHHALSLTACKTAQVIFVDEIGKLEARGLGWAPCLAPLLTLSAALHIWVVRENLVQQICGIWPVERTLVIHADAPDALSNLITACVKEF